MNKKKAANYIQDLGALIALVLLIVVIGAISPEFRTVGNFLSLLRQSSINGLIAFGMTCVILTGGIDLSVGSVLALTTALCAGFISGGMPVGLAMILALVIGTGFGCISGFLVTKGRLQPFIATLITMTVFRGLTMIYMDGKPISNLGDSFTLKVVGKGNFYTHSDSGHLVFTDFCDLLISYCRKQLSDVIFMRQEAMQKQPIWQESILTAQNWQLMRFPDVWLHFPG